jgi:hypothetical protein
MEASTSDEAPADGRRRSPAWAFAFFGLIGFIVALIGGYGADWQWTGFSDNDTLWDWLQLLLLPVAIATLPIWLQHKEYMHPRIRTLIRTVLVAFFVLVLLGYLVPLDWTGFTGNTLWDWFGLILLPVVITTVRMWPELRPRMMKRHIALTTVLFWAFVALVLFGYLLPWAWTGFTGNTLWDWIHLLAVPILLPLVLMPMSLGFIRSGVDERREEAEAQAKIDAADEALRTGGDNPMASLNHALAAATLNGPSAGLALLAPLEETLAGDYRLHAVRAHLLEMAGEDEEAIADYRLAAEGTTSFPEQEYLLAQADALGEAR